MTIFCCGCNKYVQARLTTGMEIYPCRQDLHALPFWRCDVCRNYVGCHHKTKDRTRPLGCIPTREITEKRKQIHAALDPLWKCGGLRREEVYAAISSKLGKPYHTAELRSVDEATKVLGIIQQLAGEETNGI